MNINELISIVETLEQKVKILERKVAEILKTKDNK